ncbi:hypothetical protein GOP47_0014803 [Adiantum capillus-veneris]|uniref:Tubulin epsilon chain n=1 Tax=Adiantum capillus-veneris TaxID=13818 RepID=A0A9D4UMF7_ADICA|nr:hypothetical protein GOP47_0014803 [Adiantum capillus-veneris]
MLTTLAGCSWLLSTEAREQTFQKRQSCLCLGLQLRNQQRNMPREIITIQCGQCGNQVGCKFWELALQEHAAFNPSGLFYYSMSSFFRNMDTRFEPPIELPIRSGISLIQSLEARAVLVDMEEGVVNQLLKGPLSNLFKTKQCITGISGSGNNWAHGHDVYGPQYGEAILEKIQSEAEKCESLQNFNMLHSLGGGTGSGLGSYIMEALNDNYSEVQCISIPVFPSKDDDVVTSPYNSLLAVRSLIEYSDCVLPIENQALGDILEWKWKNPKVLHYMIVANLLLHLTSSVRFDGSLNVDLNEITTNLVPSPKLHFLVSSMSPALRTSFPSTAGQQSSTFNQLFAEAILRKNQLIKANPLACTYLASAFLLRGSPSNVSDLTHNISLLRQRMKMVHWNPEGFKIGHCFRPPLHAPQALLCLANNTCIRSPFKRMKKAFKKLFRKRVYVHHYAEYMDLEMFKVALGSLEDLIEEYEAYDNSKMLH